MLRYLAPEILQKQTYHTPIDIWSFGVVLVFILTGQHPFDEGERDTVEKVTIL